MPDAIPETTPVVAPTVAVAPVQLQVPPVMSALRFVVAPAHTDVVPERTGIPFTVNNMTDEQPAVLVKEIVAVPAAMALTTPVVAPTVAMAVLLLLQVLVPAGSESTLVAPTQQKAYPQLGQLR